MWLTQKKITSYLFILIQDIKYMNSVNRVQWLVQKSIRVVEMQIKWNRTFLKIFYSEEEWKIFHKCDTILLLKCKANKFILPNLSTMAVATWTTHNIFII